MGHKTGLGVWLPVLMECDPGDPREEVAYERASSLGPERGIPDSQLGALPIQLAASMRFLVHHSFP